MGHKPALHRAALHGEQLLVELRQDEGCPQRNRKSIDDNPLLAQLEDLVEQGFLNRLQLAEWASMACLLFALKELVARIHLANLLCLSPQKK
jgi:hypothetical protein